MKTKRARYVFMAVLAYFAINCAWSARDIQAYYIENGVGFGDYNPKMWLYLAIQGVLLVITLIMGIYHQRAEIFIPAILAIGSALLFYKLHSDPFYRDWSEDCWFARTAYIAGCLIIMGLKDTINIFLIRKESL